MRAEEIIDQAPYLTPEEIRMVRRLVDSGPTPAGRAVLAEMLRKAYRVPVVQTSTGTIKDYRKAVSQVRTALSSGMRSLPVMTDVSKIVPYRGKYIYFMGCLDRIKIGIASDPVHRRMSIQTGSPYPVDLIAVIPGASPVLEKALHERFKDLRVQGEWFKAEGELLDFLEEMTS